MKTPNKLKTAEKSLEQLITEKKQSDLQEYVKVITEAGTKFNCGLSASAILKEGNVHFEITPVNL